jgi:hypothetical protein
METFGELIAGPFGAAIAIFLFIWAVLIFLLPFFVYGANKRARECSEKLTDIIAILRENQS